MSLSPRILSSAILLAFALSAHAIEPSSMSPQVRPQDDLYRAANGNWLQQTQLAPQQSETYGADLPARLERDLRALLASLKPAGKGAPSDANDVARYYAAYLDTNTIDRLGLRPVAPWLAEIAALRSPADLAGWMGKAQGMVESPLWLWGGFADLADPSRVRTIVMQGGLGLPSAEAYDEAGVDAQRAALQAGYRAYLLSLAKAAALPDPEDQAQRAFALERRIAAAHVRGPGAMAPDAFRTWSTAQARSEAPGWMWDAFLAGAGLPEGGAVNVAQPAAARGIAALLDSVPVADWQAYLRLRLLDAAAPVLPAPFRAARFAYRGQLLEGASAAPARADQALGSVRKALPEALTRLYAARHFSAAHMAALQSMFEQIRQAARDSLQHSARLDAPTRAEAIAKLDTMRAKIGYPASQRSLSAVPIEAGAAFANWVSTSRQSWAELARLHEQPVDRARWQMSPLTVNAYYDPMLNEINLPAASFQPPYFDPKADPADNWGAAGVLIAHELSHAFDPDGAQFDSQGRFRPWWSEANLARAKALGGRLAAQYSSYAALPGKQVNGALTLSENAADLSGLEWAYRAFARAPGNPAERVIDGRSGAQRFFLAYAQSLAVLRRDARTLQLLSSERHAPNEFRVNGPLPHLDSFHAAFGTRPGDQLYLEPGQRLRWWP